MTEKPPFSRRKKGTLMPSIDFAWNERPRHKTCSLFHTPDVFREAFCEWNCFPLLTVPKFNFIEKTIDDIREISS